VLPCSDTPPTAGASEFRTSGVGLRRANFEAPWSGPAKGETEDEWPRDYHKALFEWTVTVSDAIQDQLVVNSTPNERATGKMHDAKPFCDKMWKEYGPGSALQLLDKVTPEDIYKDGAN
jgi:hypothetical protein